MHNWKDRYDLKIIPNPVSDDELKRHVLMHHQEGTKDPGEFRDWVNWMTEDPSSHMKETNGKPRNYLREHHDDRHDFNREDDYEIFNHEHPWEED